MTYFVGKNILHIQQKDTKNVTFGRCVFALTAYQLYKQCPILFEPNFRKLKIMWGSWLFTTFTSIFSKYQFYWVRICYS